MNTAEIERLAKAAFEANERVTVLGMMNAPQDRDERLNAAVAYAVAQAQAAEANAALKAAQKILKGRARHERAVF